MRRRGRSLPTAVLVACLCQLLFALSAPASYDPVGGGKAKLVLDKRFAAFLRQAGVELAAAGGGSHQGRAYVLPVVGGQVDPTIGKGSIDAEGSLVFRSPRRKVPLRRIVVKTQRAPLIAKVGGSQLKVATGSGLAVKRSGFDSSISVRRLSLTEKAATRLNKKLRPAVPFAAGQVIGKLAALAEPATVAILPQGVATVRLNDGFTAKLDSLFVAANPVFPAEHQGSVFTFPIIPTGVLAPTGGNGTLKTGGSIEFLQLPQKGQVLWHESWFDFGGALQSPEVDVEPSPPYGGKAGRIAVAAMPAGAILTPDPRARTISGEGLALSLRPETAATLNQVFAEGAEVFKAGEPLGALTFTAKGQ
jgi:hypothetical protein